MPVANIPLAVFIATMDAVVILWFAYQVGSKVWHSYRRRRHAANTIRVMRRMSSVRARTIRRMDEAERRGFR